jgi:uncharacterized membrane protein
MRFVKQENSTQNAYAAVRNLIDLMELPIPEYMVEKILYHPHYPSLDAIAETLNDFDIESLPVELNIDELVEVPLPAIAHLHKNDGHFVVIKKVKGGIVHYVDPEAGLVSETLDLFEQKWSGITLIASVNEMAGKEFKQKREDNKLKKIHERISVVLIALNLLMPFIFMSARTSILLALNIVGVAVSLLLFQKQLGTTSAALNKFCQLGSKSDCDTVINSRYAKIFGIHLSEIGSGYFAGFMLTVVIAFYSGVSGNLFLFWISVLALPLCIISIYYQAFIIKSWCPLCLLVVSILVLNFIILSFNYGPLTEREVFSFIIVLLSFTIPAALWLLLRSRVITSYKVKELEKVADRFLKNGSIFTKLLNDSPKNDMRTFFGDIISGSNEAPLELTVISKPTCTPCAYLHAIIEHLQHELSGNIKIVYRFMIPLKDKSSISYQVVSHIYSMDSNSNALAAISDWYLGNGQSNLELWKENHPKGSKLSATEIDRIIEEQNRWCRSLDIRQTPTLFINSRKQPEEYSLKDIKFHLKFLAQRLEQNEMQLL